MYRRRQQGRCFDRRLQSLLCHAAQQRRAASLLNRYRRSQTALTISSRHGASGYSVVAAMQTSVHLDCKWARRHETMVWVGGDGGVLLVRHWSVQSELFNLHCSCLRHLSYIDMRGTIGSLWTLRLPSRQLWKCTFLWAG